MRIEFCTVFFCLFLASQGFGQKTVNPHFESHHLDFRDLGYPAATLIPADDSKITALIAHSNGKIYGATSGKQSYLFTFDAMTNKVYPLGKLPSSSGVHHALVEGRDGLLYIGTGKDELESVRLSKEMPHGRRMIEEQLWLDIKDKYKDYSGGTLYVYDPSEEDSNVYLPGDTSKAMKLGIPVEGNSIYAMVADQKSNKIYGITYPEAVFFQYDIDSKEFKNHGPWVTTKSYAGPERTWRSIPRALVNVDGRIYSSGDAGLIHYFDPNDQEIHSTQMRTPGEYWITQKYEGYPVVEQLLEDSSGMIYGSTSDGFVFRMDTESEHLSSLGKPMVERRVRAMTLGLDRKLYMICGERANVCRMFTYDLSDKREGFVDYGVLGVDRSPYYAKIGYQFDAMCTGSDGTIFIGESDRRAKLFFYIPGAHVYPAVLNPSNPR